MTDIIETINLGSHYGFNVRVEITHDEGWANCLNKGAYSADQVEAFKAGEWILAVLTVVARRNGIDLGRDILGDVAYGMPDMPNPSSYARECVDAYEMIGAATAEAQDTIQRLNEPMPNDTTEL